MVGTTFCAWAVITLMSVPPSWAHLSIIRQQYETSDTIEPGDRLGRSLVAGDFNGDGYEDLAMGVPEESEDVLDIALHGAVCVNYGTSFGLRTFRLEPGGGGFQ